MDKVVSALQHKLKQSQNKKGMTMFSLFLIIVVIIFLTIIFSNPDFIRKINRGRVTTAWSNELSSLSNGVLSLNNHVNILYPVRLKGDQGLDVVIPAPTVSAYEPINRYDIMKNPLPSHSTETIGIKFTGNNDAIFSGLNGYASLKVSSPTFGTQSGASTGLKINLNGLSKLGSDGITWFVNKTIPNIEESLFLGLLNQANTDLGNNFAEKGQLDLTVNTPNFADCANLTLLNTGNLQCKTSPVYTGIAKNSMETFMSLVFGTGEVKDLQLTRPISWVSLKPVNSKALKEAVGSNYRFYNTDDFTLFWIDSVAPKAEAVNLFTQFFKMSPTQADAYTPGIACVGGDCTQNEIKLAGEIYDRMLQYIQPDTLIVIPTTKSGAVYSSNSDFRLYKFSTAD